MQAVRRRHARITLFWAAGLVAFAVLALARSFTWEARPDWDLGDRLSRCLISWLVQIVPFMNISRSVSRFDAMVMLCLAVLAGLGLASVLAWASKYGKRVPAILSVAVTGLICFEYLAVPYPLTPTDTPAFYQTLAQDSGDYAVLNLPMDWDRPNYLLYQTVHGKPLISAYTSRDNPLSLVDKTPVLDRLPTARTSAMSFRAIRGKWD